MKIKKQYQPLYKYLNNHSELNPDKFREWIKENSNYLLKKREIDVIEIHSIRIWYINENFDLNKYKNQ